MKTYNFIGKKGIDDLLSEYAFIGGSQGDETASNSLEEYNKSDGWLIKCFGEDFVYTQENIDIEVKIRKFKNEKYIKELKADGKYGEEYEIQLSLKDNPLLDKQPVFDKPIPLESYDMYFIDLSK